jgi:ribosomal protein S18 acetylase RimI-like enzyme
MQIRPAEANDLDLILQMRLDFLGEVGGLVPVEATNEFRAETRAFIQRTQREDRLRTWIAEEHGDVLGIVSVVVNDVPPLADDPPSREGYITNEYVKPAARGRGVGRLLLRAAVGSADKFGIRRFSLVATDAGKPLYVKEGFASTERHMVLPVPLGGP